MMRPACWRKRSSSASLRSSLESSRKKVDGSATESCATACSACVRSPLSGESDAARMAWKFGTAAIFSAAGRGLGRLRSG